MKKILLVIGLGLLSTSAYADDYDDAIKLTATVTAYHIKCEKIDRQYREYLYTYSIFVVFGDYDEVKAEKDLFKETKNQINKYDELQQDYCNTVKEVLIK